MTSIHDFRFPGESDAYRRARDELLAAELEHRRRGEALAAQRRALPIGGPLPEDYLFLTSTGQEQRFSNLFQGERDTLVIYSLMLADAPCPMCTAFLDGLDGNAPHLEQQVNLAVVAKAPPAVLSEFADSRGWRNLRLFSSSQNTYNRDYLGENSDGGQLPMMNCFQRIDGAVHHAYATEVFLAPTEEGQHPRHVDPMWTLWNILDITPEGRPADWWPALAY